MAGEEQKSRIPEWTHMCEPSHARRQISWGGGVVQQSGYVLRCTQLWEVEFGQSTLVKQWLQDSPNDWNSDTSTTLKAFCVLMWRREKYLFHLTPLVEITTTLFHSWRLMTNNHSCAIYSVTILSPIYANAAQITAPLYTHLSWLSLFVKPAAGSKACLFSSLGVHVVLKKGQTPFFLKTICGLFRREKEGLHQAETALFQLKEFNMRLLFSDVFKVRDLVKLMAALQFQQVTVGPRVLLK